MKKLTIAAAIVCAAAMSQAAQWTWGNGSGAYYVDSSGALQQSGTFVLMYLGNGAAADWSMASAANVKQSANLVYTPSPMFPIPDENKVGNVLPLTVGVEANGQWYAVMLQDGSDYKQLIDYASGEALAAQQLAGFDNPSSTPPAFKFATSNYTVESVPEPTSGLLLLLGVAGLALKRRRA